MRWAPHSNAFRSWQVRLLAVLALLAALAAPSLASSRSAQNLAAIADDYYWALQTRLLRPSYSSRANKAWVGKLRGFERRVAHIKTANLDPQARITYRMLKAELAEQREYVTGGWLARDINGTQSPMQTLAEVAGTNQRNINDWKWTIKTLKNSARLMDSYVALLESGLAGGRPQTREAVRSAIRSLDVLVSNDRTANPFLAMDALISEALKGRPQLEPLRAELRAVVKDAVIPAHERLRTFLKRTYLPRAGKLGADRAAYLHYMDKHLGPDHPSPEELNAWGKREVLRLKKELRETAKKIDPKMTDLQSFMKALNDRPGNAYADAADLIASSEKEIARARELARKQVPVPRSVVKVRPVARYQEATVAAQYFSNAPGEGTMEVNTGKLLAGQRRNELATLVTHEVYGGHHLAAMYAERAGDGSTYRASAASTEFDEGWALYMEAQRDAQGAFTPEERVGYLVNHLWRAARLVVDTGMHTGTMSPEMAREYFQMSTFLDRKAAAAEIQRYIDWPGQALAYYSGKRKILEIRGECQRILGADFDLRGFHARMLGLGSVPMSEVRTAMIQWANRRKGQLSKQKVARSLRSRKWAGKQKRPRPRVAATRPPARSRSLRPSQRVRIGHPARAR
ncbi:MAG TPA: DUF885 domain-containing protein [Kofleriaceae bacterium]|nr:DUF885 domain-containing protein [Kofleriaceae bacterium]